MKDLKLLYLVLAVVLATALGSCNKDKDNNNDEPNYVYTSSKSSTLVQSFALKADANVMESLDSVFFTIDPTRSVIYNADSLPVGTDVSALQVTMSFNSSMSSAVFHVFDAENNSTDYSYTSTSSDKMDFRYGVTLTITSADENHTQDYVVKVNVHQQEPDSIVWPASARRDLPAAAATNLAVGTAHFNDLYWCLLHNSNGYFMSQAAAPIGPWTTQEVINVTADASSLAATSDALYLLDNGGNLMRSTDGNVWSEVDNGWKHILGGYEDRVLGLRYDNATSTYLYDEYPRRDGFEPTAIEQGFPAKGTSQFIVTENSWSIAPQAVMVGGVKADGSLNSATWGYDGTRWANISSTKNQLPALEAPTLFAYYTYSTNSSTLRTTKAVTWMVMGGRKSDGKLNTTTYVSKDQGITWAEGGNALAQGATMPAFYGAQAQVYTMTLGPNKAPARRISQATTSWECPYIFLFGGYNTKGQLYNNIWQGVLLRLTYKPLQ